MRCGRAWGLVTRLISSSCTHDTEHSGACYACGSRRTAYAGLPCISLRPCQGTDILVACSHMQGKTACCMYTDTNC